MLDTLCLTGEVGWARTSAPSSASVVSATPIALFLRENGGCWLALRADASREESLGDEARAILDKLRTRGASFERDLAANGTFARAVAELVSAGLVASDGFAGLRGLLTTSDRHRGREAGLAGRWAVLTASDVAREDAVEVQARVLLRRYGIAFRRLLAREPNAAPWRVLARVYRRLEARGEIRGGRFVNGMSGEQFALPEAVERLREIRRTPDDGTPIVISAADPLNLTGIIDEQERIRTVAATHIAYRNGVAVSAMEGDFLRPLAELDGEEAMSTAAALAGRRVPVSRGFVGRT